MGKHQEYKLYPTVGCKYQHYKGGLYEVISLAKHTETNEDMVIYKSLHFGTVYARPLLMWFDEIILSEGNVKRFEHYLNER